MAIDTRDKRASALGFGFSGIAPPLPDGNISSQADRQHMAGVYRGILAGEEITTKKLDISIDISM